MKFSLRNLLFILLPLAVISFFFLKPTQKLPVIAITQIIDHHTLDEVRQGMIAELAQQGYRDGETIQLVYENANGNMAIATQIASKFINLKPKVMVALSTQSAQLLKTPAQTHQIPLVFTAVTDPVFAKLVSSPQETSDGVTGVSDYMDPAPQLDMIRQFIPELKTLGVLYNASEVNSVSLLERFEAIAQSQGITLTRAVVNTTADAVNAAQSLVGKVDAIYFPNDNTVMAAASAVAQVGLKQKVPVFANDSASVQQGCLAALAYDRKAMGQVTAHIVQGLMEGKSTKDFAVDYDSTPKFPVVNMKTLKVISMNLPTFSEAVQKVDE
jgi:putative tryptophan/tyrosine transport system substrate-binding protein